MGFKAVNGFLCKTQHPFLVSLYVHLTVKNQDFHRPYIRHYVISYYLYFRPQIFIYHMSRQSSVLHVRICDQPRSVRQNTPSTMSSPPYPRYVPTSNPFLERFPCTTFFYIINNKKNQFFKSPNICEMAITIFMIFTQKNLLNLVNSIKFCYL